MRITYQAFAQPLQISGPRRPTITYTINLSQRGRIESENYASGFITQYAYDARHRVLRVTDPGLHIDTLSYDAIFGQLSRVARPANRVTTTMYDGFGRDTVTTTVALAPQGKEYDLLNRVTETRNNAVFGFAPDSVRYAYDNLFPTTVTSHVTGQLNQVYSLQHNALGAQTVETDPAATSQRFFYDNRGLLTLRMNARGDSIITTYDALYRPQIVTLKRGNSIVRADSFFYDPAGRIVVGSNKHSRDSVYLSASGWTDSVVTRFTTDMTKRIRILYRKDTTERLVEVTALYPSGIASTTRQLFWSDTRDVLDSIFVAGQKVSLTYNSELLLGSMSQPGSVTRTMTRTTSHNAYSWSFNQTAIDTLVNRAAGFDSLGRVRIASRSAGFKEDRLVTSYRYDARGRLTHAADTLYDYAGPAAPCPGNFFNPIFGMGPCSGALTKVEQYSDQWTYNEVGNIVFNNDQSGNGLPGYSNNRITSWPGGFTYATDADGNVITRTPPSPGSPANLYWSPDGLLDSVKVGSSRKRYDYNAFGMLVRLWEGAGPTPQRHYVWDQGHLLIELNGALTQRRDEFAYLPGTDRPIALLTGATALTARRYLYQDVQGSVIGAVFDNGTLWRYQINSDPWSASGGGFIGTWSGTPPLPDTLALRWQGLLWESSLGGNALYYARARWYDPRTKRFLSPDPLGVAAGVNPYRFAAGDPLNLADPWGLQECSRAKKDAGYTERTNEAGEVTCEAPTIRTVGRPDPWLNFRDWVLTPGDRGGRPWTIAPISLAAWRVPSTVSRQGVPDAIFDLEPNSALEGCDDATPRSPIRMFRFGQINVAGQSADATYDISLWRVGPIIRTRAIYAGTLKLESIILSDFYAITTAPGTVNCKTGHGIFLGFRIFR